MDKITVAVPCYNEEPVLDLFYSAITAVAKEFPGTDFEFLFIDDGSRDNTLGKVQSFAQKDSRVKYISFSRKGKPPLRSFFARLFYKIINKISDADIVDGARDYQMMNRKVVDAILSMGEYNRFSKGIFGWIGYRKKWLEYENIERAAGETKWSFWSLMLYAIQGIIAFSTAPLVLSSVLGLLCCVLALVMIVVIIIRTLAFGDPTAGWPSLVCIILLLSGIQMLGIGILGQYLAKTYLETKRRPIYLVAQTNIETRK